MIGKKDALQMREWVIVRVVGRALIPFILLFALYVQFHGDFGPGGGFQAGVIFAAGFVLFGLIYGSEALNRLLPPRWLEATLALGVLLYGGVGVANMLMGGAYLDYNAFTPADPAHGQHLGILLIEAGVGMTVAAAMIVIFKTFAGRGQT